MAQVVQRVLKWYSFNKKLSAPEDEPEEEGPVEEETEFEDGFIVEDEDDQPERDEETEDVNGEEDENIENEEE